MFCLRHTFASHLAMRGVHLKVIKDLLGHVKFETMLRYAHLSPSTMRDAVDLLEKPAAPKEHIRSKTDGECGGLSVALTSVTDS